MYMRKVLISFLGVMLFLVSCSSPGERNMEVEERSTSIEEILFTSALFTTKRKDSNALFLASKVNNNALKDLRGLYAVQNNDILELNRKGDYHYNQNNGMLYTVDMDAIKKQLGKDIALVGVYKDIVVIQNTSSEFNNEVLWEYVEIGDDTVFMIHANAVLSFQTGATGAFFTATHDSYLEDGFLWQAVKLFKMPRDGQAVVSYGEITALPSYEYALSPVFDYLEVGQRSFQVADGIVYRILDEEIVELGDLHERTEKLYILSNFMTHGDSIYAIIYNGSATVLVEWDSNWTVTATTELPDYSFEEKYYTSEVYSHFLIEMENDTDMLIGKLESSVEEDTNTSVYVLRLDVETGTVLMSNSFDKEGNFVALE